MFGTVLIANRGEIACRVLRTCRRLGIRSVAVFSEADRGALFTRLADVAIEIGEAAPRDSYLRIDRVLSAARESGAEAVHPGYGFLAENAEFARACAEAKLKFIGPSPEAIEAMGMKDAAKALMQRAGVPVVPGYHEGDQSPARLRSEAERIGFPVLIKAVAGGGGKGMRLVQAAGEFEAAVAAAKREAESAFGEGRVLIEKYLVKPRHIEVQVLADPHGNTVALHERDCSLQRRHQKLVEEAPAPFVSAALRERLATLAVNAARAVRYEGAGTIEMIADTAQGLSAERIYFMEMNTRLQVEHPVTELITGLDLVEWQLRVASGQRLSFTQAEVPLRGHAIEVRICAEDPEADDAPRTGRLEHVAFPAPSPEVRIETGVQSGDVVSAHYDSMLAKLVVWGEDRSAALRRMSRCLSEVELAGLASNVAFLKAAVEHPEFRAGRVHTGLLAEQRAGLLSTAREHLRELLLLAVVGRLATRQRASRDVRDPYSPWLDTRSFRLNAPAEDHLRLRASGKEHTARVRFVPFGLEVELEGVVSRVLSETREGPRLSFEVDSRRVSGSYVQPAADTSQRRAFVTYQGASLEVVFGTGHEDDDDADAALGAIRSPLPGRIVSVFVAEGASVHKGDPLVSLEAMKMEHTLHAGVDGVVTALSVGPRDQVTEGSILLVLEAPKES